MFEYEMKAKGLSQRMLSELIDCDPSTVSGWIRGKLKISHRYLPKLIELEFSREALESPERKCCSGHK